MKLRTLAEVIGMCRHDAQTDCLIWTGSMTNKGYGYISHNGKWWFAHRLSWTLANGPIPDGKWVLHKCDRPSCINPTHLFLGNHTDNMRDMVSKGRDKSPRGETHPFAKFSDEMVRRVRSAYVRGEITHKQLAEQYGISRQHVTNIIAGLRRKSA